MVSSLRVGLLVSGGGTTMENVASRALRGELGDVWPVVVIAQKVCDGIGKAKALGIPTYVISKKDFGGNVQLWGTSISEMLGKHGANTISQNGWVPRTPAEVLSGNWEIYNQHPGILSGKKEIPDFGGAQMCGTAVTAATLLHHLESDEEDPERLITQSTVHAVTEGIDEGTLIRVVNHSIADIVHACRKKGIRTIEDAQSKSDEFNDLVEEIKRGLLPVEHDNVAEVLRGRANGILQGLKENPAAMCLDRDVLSRVKLAAAQMYPTK